MKITVEVEVSDDLALSSESQALVIFVPPYGGALAEVRCGPLREFGPFVLTPEPGEGRRSP